MRVLVAGGAGFIGSHLCERLLQEGHNVICVDNLITGSKNNIQNLISNPNFEFIQQDVTLELQIKVDVIFHLASPASPVGYMAYPVETILVNSMGTYRLLELARGQQAKFLMASTSEAYGDPLVHPQREDYWGNVNPVGPRSCYDESKRVGETLTMEYVRTYNLDARIVRIFNTYGPHSQRDDGRLVPNFITQALQNVALTVYGTGKQTRSLCYVSDLVDGLIRAMFHADTRGEIFNLGNPEEHTVLEFAEIISKLCHSHSEIRFLEKREDDPEQRKPDITKAHQILGWMPTVNLQDGLQRTIEWFQKPKVAENIVTPQAHIQ